MAEIRKSQKSREGPGDSGLRSANTSRRSSLASVTSVLSAASNTSIRSSTGPRRDPGQRVVAEEGERFQEEPCEATVHHKGAEGAARTCQCSNNKAIEFGLRFDFCEKHMDKDEFHRWLEKLGQADEEGNLHEVQQEFRTMPIDKRKKLLRKKASSTVEKGDARPLAGAAPGGASEGRPVAAADGREGKEISAEGSVPPGKAAPVLRAGGDSTNETDRDGQTKVPPASDGQSPESPPPPPGVMEMLQQQAPQLGTFDLSSPDVQSALQAGLTIMSKGDTALQSSLSQLVGSALSSAESSPQKSDASYVRVSSPPGVEAN